MPQTACDNPEGLTFMLWAPLPSKDDGGNDVHNPWLLSLAVRWSSGAAVNPSRFTAPGTCTFGSVPISSVSAAPARTRYGSGTGRYARIPELLMLELA